MGKTVEFEQPQPKQVEFMQAKAKHIGFGGARGGGKSWSVRTKAVLMALRYKGIRILIVRRSYPELVNNHIRILRKQLAGVARYNDKEKSLMFRNGSGIFFTYCAKDADLDRQQGVEYDVIFADEATQLSEFQMKTIVACLRGVNNFPKRVYYTCNPGGQGHQYIKRIFIDRRYDTGEDPEDYVFIQSRVTDNRKLLESQPDYVRQLEALPPKLRKAWLDGDWNVFEGQFFEEFADRPEYYKDRTWTHVIDPFEIDPNWKIYRSFDWGYHRPFSCGWWAVDYEGVVYRILELYGCSETPNEGLKWPPPKVFAEIHRIETEHRWLSGKKIIGIADPAIWDGETGESIADVAAKHQVYFDKADNKRLPGWMQMHYRFAFDENGIPMMYIFSNCKAFIRTIPLLQYDDHVPEDLDTDGEDHVADEARYFLMSRPITPKVPAKGPNGADPTKIFLDIDQKDLLPASRRPRMEILEGGEAE